MRMIGLGRSLILYGGPWRERGFCASSHGAVHRSKRHLARLSNGPYEHPTVTPKGKALEALNEEGKVTVKVKIAFTSEGVTKTKTKTLVLKKTD